jgi:2-oxoglutarate ferredoxin oxidoreductase subunit alpha
VLVLSDTNLATGVSFFPRPEPNPAWLSPAPDQTPWPEGVAPYGWDPETGLSSRAIPGQRGGEYVVTGLAHTQNAKVSYDPASNQEGCNMRSRKLATLQKTLATPEVHGAPEGDLLIVGWGSTLGSIEEAVDRLRAEGEAVSSVHLRFLSPLEPGLEEIFSRFRQVITVEINYSDPADDPDLKAESRRRSQLAQILRERTLLDIDCWSVVSGQPIQPRAIEAEIRRRLAVLDASEKGAELCSA